MAGGCAQNEGGGGASSEDTAKEQILEVRLASNHDQIIKAIERHSSEIKTLLLCSSAISIPSFNTNSIQGRLSSVQLLDLGFTETDDKGVQDVLSVCLTLKILKLRKTKITASLRFPKDTGEHLFSLDLFGTQVTQETVAHILEDGRPRLAHVDLTDTQVASLLFFKGHSYPSIRRVDLIDLEVGDTDVKAMLLACKNMRFLTLTGTKITDAFIPLPEESAQSLLTLNVSATALTFPALTSLIEGCKKLTTLEVYALPNCSGETLHDLGKIATVHGVTLLKADPETKVMWRFDAASGDWDSYTAWLS